MAGEEPPASESRALLLRSMKSSSGRRRGRPGRRPNGRLPPPISLRRGARRQRAVGRRKRMDKKMAFSVLYGGKSCPPPPSPRPGPRQSLFVVSVAAATAMKKWNAAAGAACDGRAGGAEEITWASGRLAGRRRWRRSLSHVGE